MVQVVDALFDHDHGRRVAFIVKDPKPYMVLHKDRFGHGNRSWNYAIPTDATCVFETDATLGVTPQEVRNSLRTGLVFGFTDLRYYSSGDVWLCDVPAMLQEHAVLRLRLDLGNGGAHRLTSRTWRKKTRYLDVAPSAATSSKHTRSDLCKTLRVAPTICTISLRDCCPQARHHRHLFIAISALPCHCRCHGRTLHCACLMLRERQQEKADPGGRLVSRTRLLRGLPFMSGLDRGFPPCSNHICPSFDV